MDRSGHQGIEETAAQPSCSFLTSGDAQRRSGVDSPDPATASPPAPCPRCSGRRGRASPLGVDRLASSTIGVVGQPGPTCRLLGAVELGRQRPGDREHRGPVDQHRPLAPAPTRQIRGVSRGPRSTAGRSRPPISTAFRRQARTLCSMRPGHDAVVLHPSVQPGRGRCPASPEAGSAGVVSPVDPQASHRQPSCRSPSCSALISRPAAPEATSIS
jgi:hypothetical protein